MRISSAAGYALSASAALALLAGCSGGGSQGTPGLPSAGQQSVQHVVPGARLTHSVLAPNTAVVAGRTVTTPSFMHDTLSKNLIFVSDAADNVVDIYPEKGKNQTQVGQITGFNEPQGLAADSNGNLYVANTGASQVLVYGTPYTSVKKTINDANNFPVGVAVSSKTKGLTGVTNICSAPNCSAGSGSVTIYQGKTACATVADATNFSRVYFDAFDQKDNLYIDGENANGGVVVGVVKGGCKATSIKLLTTGNAISFPGGIQINDKGQIVIDDQSGAAVYTYNAPVKGSLGSPVKTTPLSGSSDPVTFAFTTSGKNLYTADAGNANSAEYPYPAGGSAINTIAVGGQPIGIAITPPVTQ